MWAVRTIWCLFRDKLPILTSNAVCMQIPLRWHNAKHRWKYRRRNAYALKLVILFAVRSRTVQLISTCLQRRLDHLNMARATTAAQIFFFCCPFDCIHFISVMTKNVQRIVMDTMSLFCKSLVLISSIYSSQLNPYVRRISTKAYPLSNLFNWITSYWLNWLLRGIFNWTRQFD